MTPLHLIAKSVTINASVRKTILGASNYESFAEISINNKLKSIKLLVEAGADINAKNSK